VTKVYLLQPQLAAHQHQAHGIDASRLSARLTLQGLNSEFVKSGRSDEMAQPTVVYRALLSPLRSMPLDPDVGTPAPIAATMTPRYSLFSWLARLVDTEATLAGLLRLKERHDAKSENNDVHQS